MYINQFSLSFIKFGFLLLYHSPCTYYFCPNKTTWSKIIDRRYMYMAKRSLLGLVRVMMLNATFNIISVISRLSVLLVEETEVTGENHRPAVSHRQLYHIMLYRVHLVPEWDSNSVLVVKGTDCMCNVNSTTIRSRPWLPLTVILISWQHAK